MGECRVNVVVDDQAGKFQILLQIPAGGGDDFLRFGFMALDGFCDKVQHILFHIGQQIELTSVILIKCRSVHVGSFTKLPNGNVVYVLFLQQLDQRGLQQALCHRNAAILFFLHGSLLKMNFF